MSTNYTKSSPSRADPLASSFSTSYAGVVAFVAVATEGSFARAGDRLGIGRSAVSRNVRKLEDQLDARLFVRTTRSTSMTVEGERFYENCQPGVERILQALEDMRDSREGPPRGQLRISSPSAFGREVVMPLLGEFHALYPGLSLELTLDGRHADFISDGIDVAFRDGRMEDSQIVAKQLVPMQLMACASPRYVHARGLPGSVDSLGEHECINYRTDSGRVAEWEFKVDGHVRKLTPESMYTFNDLDLVLQAALDGQGIAQLPGFQVGEHLRDGTLVACLAHQSPDDRGHYICYLSRHHLPTRIRVFVDYMTARIRALDQQHLTVVPPSVVAGVPQPAVDRVLPVRRTESA
jgi:DNA-binding transcriptional LysR family regulator